jgi:hypothetical protein
MLKSFFNLRVHPHVKIEVQDRQLEAEAELATPEKRNTLWSQLISLSPAYAKYATKQLVKFHLQFCIR